MNRRLFSLICLVSLVCLVPLDLHAQQHHFQHDHSGPALHGL